MSARNPTTVLRDLCSLISRCCDGAVDISKDEIEAGTFGDEIMTVLDSDEWKAAQALLRRPETDHGRVGRAAKLAARMLNECAALRPESGA